MVTKGWAPPKKKKKKKIRSRISVSISSYSFQQYSFSSYINIYLYGTCISMMNDSHISLEHTLTYFVLLEIISKLIRGGPEPFRLSLPKVDDDIPPEAVKLIEVCWNEEPSNRPTFERIGNIAREINGNKYALSESFHFNVSCRNEIIMKYHVIS